LRFVAQSEFSDEEVAKALDLLEQASAMLAAQFAERLAH